MERLLPQNIEAECGVLGSIIIDPEAITRVADFLKPEDFWRDAHRMIYQALMDLSERDMPADFITLCDELERRGQLKEVGDASYITSLVNCVPTSGNIIHYGRIVQKKATHRRLIHAAGVIAASAYSEEFDAQEKAESLIFQISKQSATTDFVPNETTVFEVMEDLQRLNERQGDVIGVPTGFHDLDRCLGGLQRSDLIIGAGRPGMGKTSFALNIAYHAAMKHDFHVGIFSCEMSRKQLILRWLSMDTGTDSQVLRNGRFPKEDWLRLVHSSDQLAAAPIWIDDTGGISQVTLRSRARRLQAEQGLDLLIVDYLQLMQATLGGNRIEDRRREVEEISGALKALAKELDIPVLALAQLSRSVESRQVKVPQLSDLRESGSIENDADIVLFLYRDDYYAGFDEFGDSKSDRPGTADVIVAKHRNGPTGEISLCFDAPHTRFFNDEQERLMAYGQ